MTTTKNSWFDVDKEGLAAQLERRHPSFVLLELLQNAFDEEVSKVEITTMHIGGGLYEVTCHDDSPEGFVDLTDAYTFFKPSKKRSDAEKRGRFNSGEKMVLAMAQSASVHSTRGAVLFHSDGTREFNGRSKRNAGTTFKARLRMGKEAMDSAIERTMMAVAPEGVAVVINGQPLRERRGVRAFAVSGLPTEVDFKPTRRSAVLTLMEVLDDETPMIYEMGIPVVEVDLPWHINVNQCIPLNTDRDNITPAFLRRIREEVLNNAHDLLGAEDAKAPWVKAAMPAASASAAKQVVELTYGKKAVIFDPSKPEANKQALEQGYTLVPGRAFGKEEWAAIKAADVLQPAGKVIEVGVPTSPDGKPPIPYEDWTSEMKRLGVYTMDLGLALLGFRPKVQFQNITPFEGRAGQSAAWWGDRTITFNLGNLGKAWPERVSAEALDALLIHEFAHEKVDDHLTRAFSDECCRLGAALRWKKVWFK